MPRGLGLGLRIGSKRGGGVLMGTNEVPVLSADDGNVLYNTVYAGVDKPHEPYQVFDRVNGGINGYGTAVPPTPGSEWIGYIYGGDIKYLTHYRFRTEDIAVWQSNMATAWRVQHSPDGTPPWTTVAQVTGYTTGPGRNAWTETFAVDTLVASGAFRLLMDAYGGGDHWTVSELEFLTYT